MEAYDNCGKYPYRLLKQNILTGEKTHDCLSYKEPRTICKGDTLPPFPPDWCKGLELKRKKERHEQLLEQSRGQYNPELKKLGLEVGTISWDEEKNEITEVRTKWFVKKGTKNTVDKLEALGWKQAAKGQIYGGHYEIYI